MNVNLHLLDASGSLNKFTKAINDSFTTSVNTISKYLEISDIDIVVFDDPTGAIPEFGMGGYTPNAHLVFVSIDPNFANLGSSIEDEFKKSLAHEFHHAMRWRNPGYGSTLLEALITEGLADHFTLEVFGGSSPPWSLALNDKKTSEYLLKAKEEFNDDNYDHNSWFFGSKEKNIPRWAGYSLGYKLVEEYLKSHPGEKASTLYKVKADNFIASSLK